MRWWFDIGLIKLLTLILNDSFVGNYVLDGNFYLAVSPAMQLIFNQRIYKIVLSIRCLSIWSFLSEDCSLISETNFKNINLD